MVKRAVTSQKKTTPLSYNRLDFVCICGSLQSDFRSN